MNTQRTGINAGIETELTLAVAPVGADEFGDGDIAVEAHFAPEASAGTSYRVVLTIKNHGDEAAGAFDVTARAYLRNYLGGHRVRTVTHSVASLEPGASVTIDSIRVPRFAPVTVRGVTSGTAVPELEWVVAAPVAA